MAFRRALMRLNGSSTSQEPPPLLDRFEMALISFLRPDHLRLQEMPHAALKLVKARHVKIVVLAVPLLYTTSVCRFSPLPRTTVTRLTSLSMSSLHCEGWMSAAGPLAASSKIGPDGNLLRSPDGPRRKATH
jgi:hypothetical protein